MVTPAGVVKVLDFGLAAVAQPSDPSDPANSPTRAGMILGTAAYMSPEQARGKVVDKRADIWAFGVVLFEMFTGKRLFEGETVSDTLAQVLTKEPDWEQVPVKVRRLLEACLQKDARQRLQAIGDWSFLLMDAPTIADCNCDQEQAAVGGRGGCYCCCRGTELGRVPPLQRGNPSPLRSVPKGPQLDGPAFRCWKSPDHRRSGADRRTGRRLAIQQ